MNIHRFTLVNYLPTGMWEWKLDFLRVHVIFIEYYFAQKQQNNQKKTNQEMLLYR